MAQEYSDKATQIFSGKVATLYHALQISQCALPQLETDFTVVGKTIFVSVGTVHIQWSERLGCSLYNRNDRGNLWSNAQDPKLSDMLRPISAAMMWFMCQLRSEGFTVVQHEEPLHGLGFTGKSHDFVFSLLYGFKTGTDGVFMKLCYDECLDNYYLEEFIAQC